MPLFEYRCTVCNKTFEKLAKTPAREIPCPDCGQPAQKIVSVVAAGGDNSCSAPAGSGFR